MLEIFNAVTQRLEATFARLQATGAGNTEAREQIFGHQSLLCGVVTTLTNTLGDHQPSLAALEGSGAWDKVMKQLLAVFSQDDASALHVLKPRCHRAAVGRELSRDL